MAPTIALVVYYLAAVLAMVGALYLWRELSLRRVTNKLAAITASQTKQALANDEQRQTIETERAAERRSWISEFQHAREHIDRLRLELQEARSGSFARWKAYEEMRKVWHAESGATEDEAKALLRNHMWVLEPEFRLVGERIEW